MTDTVAADQLRSIVTRIENVEAEIKELNEGKSEIYSEAKANGWDVKVIKRIVADRRKPAAEREEFEAVMDVYLQALGMPSLVHARETPKKHLDPKLVETIAKAVQTDIGRKALGTAVDIMIARQEAAQ